MGKKLKYVPVVLCGSFFETEYLNSLKKEVMKEADEKIDLISFLEAFFKSVDSTKMPIIKDMLLVNSNQVLDNEDVEGFYIGINFLSVPEHVSIKRATIDVRELFEKSGLMSPEEDSDAVGVFARVVKI